MMKGKTWILVGFCLFIAAGTAFAAGSKASGGGGGGGTPTLTIGIGSSPSITDYKDNYLTHYMEKLHNIDIQFYLLPDNANDLRTKVALMVSSNDMPDIINSSSLTREAIFNYGSQGAFIALDKYFASPATAPNYFNIPEADRAIYLRSITSSDGHIYHFAKFEPETWNLTPFRQYINKAWLDKLGLPIPATTEQFRQTMLRLKTGDPNGNGRQDEIGITGFFKGTYGENTITALINSFVFYIHGSSGVGLTLDAAGQKVIAPFTDPNFRKALQYLNTLYRDGILSPSIFTNDQQTFRAELNATPPVAAFTAAGSLSNWPLASTNRNANFAEMRMVPPMKGPDGVAYSPYTGYNPPPVTYITSSAKNPDLAFKVMESMLEHTLSIIQRFGEEGVDWTRDPNILKTDSNAYVSLGIYPSLSIMEMTDIWYGKSNKFWYNQGPRYASMQQGNTRGSLQSPFNPDSYAVMVDSYNYEYNLNAHPQHIIPFLSYTLAEAEQNIEPIMNVNNYVSQSIAEFVTSGRDINNDAQWNAYLTNLNNMGLPAWIKNAQAAFNRVK